MTTDELLEVTADSPLSDQIAAAYDEHLEAEQRRLAQLEVSAQAAIKRTLRRSLSWKGQKRSGRAALPVRPPEEWEQTMYDPPVSSSFYRGQKVDFKASGEYLLHLGDDMTAVIAAFAERSPNGGWDVRLYLKDKCDECNKNDAVRTGAITSLGKLGAALDGDGEAVCGKCRAKIEAKDS